MGKSPWSDDDDNNNKDKKDFHIFEKFDRFSKGNKNPDFKMPDFDFSGKFISYALLVLLGMWGFSGFYKVDEGERGAVLRFGEFVRTSEPGLNYHFPYPIEKVYIENVNTVRKIEVGYRSNRNSNVLKESIMLTGDENIVDLTSNVFWRISDLNKYLFNITMQESAVRSASESAIREVIAETPIAPIISNKKQEIASKIREVLDQTLKNYDAGVEIVQVQLLRAEPPVEVIDSYRDVQASKADKQKFINEAQSYRNNTIPKARGEAARTIALAEGYKKEVIARAEGDAAYFLAIYEEYKKNPQVNKVRLYLDTIEKILSNSGKYILGSDVLPHIPVGNAKNLPILENN